MLRARVTLPGGESTTPNQDIVAMLGALASVWSRWLMRHRGFPLLYQSGVVYRPEIDTEDWLSPSEVLAAGGGDCEDLTLWRVAELLASGVQCFPRCVGKPSAVGGLVQHVFVGFPGGRTEDPSLILMPRKSHG